MEFLFLLLVVLFVLLVLLAIMTVAGHAMWLMVAAVLRFFFSDGNTSPNYHRQSTRIFEPSVKPADDLDITERQIVTFYVDSKIDERTYNQLIRRIRAERAGHTPAVKVPASAPVPPPKPVEVPRPAEAPSVVTAALVASDDEIVIKPVPTFIIDDEPPPPKYKQPTPPPRPPRRPFSEVLNSFMEE